MNTNSGKANKFHQSPGVRTNESILYKDSLPTGRRFVCIVLYFSISVVVTISNTISFGFQFQLQFPIQLAALGNAL